MPVISRISWVWLVIAGGLAALLSLAWGLAFGGVQLGRVDPLFSLSGRILVAVLLAVVVARQAPRSIAIAAFAMLGASLALDSAQGAGLADRIAWRQMAAAALVEALAFAGAIGLVRIFKPAQLRLAMLVVAATAVGLVVATAQLLPKLYAVPAASVRPPLAVMAGVPIDWLGQADMGAILSGTARRSPVAQLLEGHYAVDRLDTIDADSLSSAKNMLLAHPRALSPAELVALDQWVRGGGRVLILADGLLSWPPEYPIGDVRNPPVTSLLTPLLSHWGLDLAAPGNDGADLFMAHDARVLAVSMGRFTAASRDCRISLGGRRADCVLGEGRAILVADADLLDPVLWTDGRPGAAYWHQGNMDWVLSLIDTLADNRPDAWFDPVWMTPRG